MEKFFELCKTHLGSEHFCIAGGSIVSFLNHDEPKDLDCFFINQTYYNLALEHISFRAKEIKRRRNSVQFELSSGAKIDVIFTGKDSFRSIIEDFDLVHCCHYYTPSEGIVSLDKAVEYARNYTLHLKTITLPYFTLGRIAKYRTRGFSMDSNQENQILYYCYKAPWGPGNEVEYQLEK